MGPGPWTPVHVLYTSRSNSPPAMSSDQMPRPGEDLVHQIPSLPGSKRRQMSGVCPGGCLSFDLTDTLIPNDNNTMEAIMADETT